MIRNINIKWLTPQAFPANNGILLEQIVFCRFQPYRPGDALG
jgi:hypothetical protein